VSRFLQFLVDATRARRVIARGIDPREAFAALAASLSVWGEHRTTVSVLAVTPARAGAHIEIEAVARSRPSRHVLSRPALV